MLQGELDLSRRRDSDNNDYIHIEVIDSLSRARFFQMNVSLEAMMCALTNLAAQPVEFELTPELVGKTRENKTVVIPCKPYGMKLDEKLALLVPYEVDGWKAYLADLENHHNYSDKGIRVNFVRHIA